MKIADFSHRENGSGIDMLRSWEERFSSGTAKVLAVDDAEDCLEMLQEVLARPRWELRVCRNSAEALEIALEFIPDIILMDVRMPGEDGYRVCQRIKQHPQLSDIPVVFSVHSVRCRRK